MVHRKILIACLIGLFTTACDTQQQPTPKPSTQVKKTTEIVTAPENTHEQATAATKPRPALKLSIDDIPVEQPVTDDNFYLYDEGSAEETSALFRRQYRDKHNISFSGKVFTDEDRLENKDYRNSVDGLQINIEGNFD